MDQESLQSVLVPRGMLYGFLGFEGPPKATKCIRTFRNKRPLLTISGTRVHNRVLTITAHADGRADVSQQ